jgi:hypothetical protein
MEHLVPELHIAWFVLEDQISLLFELPCKSVKFCNLMYIGG